ncbi:Uncharacterised protein [Klebsiella pneumoniae]|nr:Uncharacterised protein [Klebsiella pneumoniae]VUL87406.1 Uncharacterised protein [Klebsiella pneumoniae]
MRGHEVDGFHRTQGNHPVVFTAIAHHADGTNRQEHGERLADFVIQVSFVQLFDEDSVRTTQQVAVLFLHFAQHAHAKAGARERVTVEHVVRQAQFQADLTHFVFEQLTQRLNQAHLHLFRQAAHVVVRFDDVRFTGGGSGRLDNVRVDGTLRQPFDVVQLQRFFVEHFHENATDNFTLRFRIAFTRQRVEETLLAFNVNNVQAKVVAEHLHHLLRFVQAQQTVVHEYAGQVFADSAVQQHRGHRRVHTAGEAEDHFVVANLLTDTLNGVVNDFRRGPQRFALADVAHEALQHTHPLTGVGHFRVELHAVEAFFFVGHNGERAVVGAGDGYEVRWDGGHFVAVAHPHVQQRFAVCGQGIFDTAHQRAVVNHFNLCVTKLTLVRTFYMAAQLHRHGLHAVADAKYRHAGFEHILRRARAVLFGGAFRAAGKNDAAWIKFADLCFRDIPCPQLTVDAQLTHATRHQLSILRPEVEDEDAMFMNVFRH